jgi:hypothetical protein
LGFNPNPVDSTFKIKKITSKSLKEDEVIIDDEVEEEKLPISCFQPMNYL